MVHIEVVDEGAFVGFAQRLHEAIECCGTTSFKFLYVSWLLIVLHIVSMFSANGVCLD